MKRIVHFTAIVALTILMLLGISIYAPTFYQQVPFNSWVWNHAQSPFGRIKYYMSESLIEYLNDTRPTFQEAHELLGEDFMDKWENGRFKNERKNRYLEYTLKDAAFSLLMDRYTLSITFDENGNYESAKIYHED